jgi:hypothetical protein
MNIKQIKKSNKAYKNFVGYYRHNSNRNIDTEVVSPEGSKGNAGEPDGEKIKKIIEALPKND